LFRALPDDSPADNDVDGVSGPFNVKIGATEEAALRLYLPIVVILGMSMLVDAAYSGDWSRIGAITKAQEKELQGIFRIALVGHAVCAVVAASLSSRRGDKTWALRGAKVLATGFVGLVEVALLPEKATK